MRKILKNNSKSNRISGRKKGKIGLQLNITDKENNFLCVGDPIKYGKYIGMLVYNPSYDQYGVALSDSKWYGDDPYDISSYGKFISIPMDNGGRMEIEKLSEG